MVPAAVVAMDSMPLTVNGKLDTGGLPAPQYQDADRYRAPDNAIEEILAGIYAEVLGLDRVGIDEPFFELGGDSILAMQVVARARAAGVTCRPRDIFVEQTVAGVARVAGVTDGAAIDDDGVGDVMATPIMEWLHSVDGPVDQFNQTVLLQAPAGATADDAAAVLRALIDRHPMLRLRVDDDGGRRSLVVPETESVAAAQLRDVGRRDVRRCAGRGPVQVAPSVRGHGQRAVGGLHLPAGADRPPSGGRRCVVADPVGRLEHRLAPARGAAGRSTLPAAGTSFRRWAALLAEHAQARPSRTRQTHGAR